MSQTIRILSEQTANQIAAGEVVTRPASVVKELIENSIDAGSSRIEIKLKEGGLKSIQVIDDGIGMSKSDCKMAFFRHATSKINDTEDLFNINTLGFRGEALPSIASVSKMKLTSRQRGALEGVRVVLYGGKLIETLTVGCSTGTDILVEDLFFNVPARKKYISKHSTEAYHSIDIVQKMAIAYPNISFKFWHNEHLIFTTSGSGGLQDVLAMVYGLEYADKTIPIKYKTGKIQINGVIGKSFFHRSNRERQVFIVNGRIVRNKLIQTSLESAYQGKLPIKRFPIAFVNINIPAQIMDVNVHPAKSEIKFICHDEVAQALISAFTNGLKSSQHIPSLIEKEKVEYSISELNQVGVPEVRENYLQSEFKTNTIFAEEPKAQSLSFRHGFESLELKLACDEQSSKEKQIENKAGKQTTSDFPVLRAVGQIFESFIVAEGNDALYFIDQHGAHERVHYERLIEKYNNQDIVSQGIIIPVLLKLNPIESKLLVENILLLANLGIAIEHFGNNDFLIRAVPQNIDGNEAAELIKEIFQGMRGEEQISYNFLADQALKLMACKQVVKAKMPLSLAEQQALIEALSLTQSPYTCPHGRPIITNVSLNELKGRFKRN